MKSADILINHIADSLSRRHTSNIIVHLLNNFYYLMIPNTPSLVSGQVFDCGDYKYYDAKV